MTTIAAGTTQNTGYVATVDSSGNLVFQTNGTTTALTLDTSQNASIVGSISASGASINGTANVTTAVNIGANVNLTTSNVKVGNSSSNVSITGQSISVVSDTLVSGLNTSPSTKLKAIGTNASYIVTAISNNSVEAFMGADTTNRAIFGAYTNHGVELRANNDAKVIAYSNGVVTLPYQPMVSVELSGIQTIAHNTDTKINFDTITSSTAAGSSSYSTTNKRFTAPIAGSYLICFHLYIYSTDQVEGYIFKNGTNYIRRAGRTADKNSNPNGIEMSHILRLAAGDYIEIWAYQSRYGDTAAASVYTAGNRPTHLSIMLLG